jgi:RNA polymerase sigma-70 factor, ECF subfamily
VVKTRRPPTRGDADRADAPAAHGHADAIPNRAPLALADVYREHSGFVWRVVRRLGIPDAAVEDVMHDVFMVVHRRLPEYDGRAAMTTWLFNIARGVASNHKRGKHREARRLELVSPRPGAAPDPEVHTERRRAADFVRDFLDELDGPKRRVFELAEIDGLPIPEVAEICKINLNTAYSRLRAARHRFAQAVAKREREHRSSSTTGSTSHRVAGGES